MRGEIMSVCCGPLLLRVYVLALICLLGACGGGGGGGSSSPPPPLVISVQTISKTVVPVDTTFVVSGTNLTLVTSWQIGNSTISVISASPSTATLKAPGSPVSGSLRANGSATGHTLQVYV